MWSCRRNGLQLRHPWGCEGGRGSNLVLPGAPSSGIWPWTTGIIRQDGQKQEGVDAKSLQNNSGKSAGAKLVAKEKCQLYVLQTEEGTTASLWHLPQRTQLPPEHVELLCHNGTESSSRARIFPNGQASRPGKLPINLPWDQLHPIFQRQRAKKKKKIQRAAAVCTTPTCMEWNVAHTRLPLSRGAGNLERLRRDEAETAQKRPINT